MKTILKLFFGIIIIALISCEDKIVQTRIYTANKPKYMSYSEFRAPKQVDIPQPVSKMGKLYFKDNLLFIGEQNKGVHIFDNSNPSDPQNIGFIEIPGNSDIAIKENNLYANSCIDLVVFDVTDFQNIKETGRLENIFPYYYPEYNSSYPITEIDNSKGVIIDFEEVEIEEEYVENSNSQWLRFMREDDINTYEYTAKVSNNQAVINNTGTGGSMARFNIYKNYLYTVQNWSLQPFNIADLKSPVTEPVIYVNRNVETIFRRADKLFLGTTTGLIIYDLAKNPAQPSFVSDLNHANSCDPVVVEGNYAYITLRQGNLCNSTSNQLDVVDISDLYNPSLVISYPMTNPYGLGIDNGILFICDGSDGLKVYDASDPNKIDQNLLYHFKNINAYDVIPLGKILMMIGEDGLFQYDYSNLNDLKLLSKIIFE